VESLRRTRTGDFTLEQAVGLESSVEDARQRILPIVTAVGNLDRVTLGPTEVKTFRHGNYIELSKNMVAARDDVAVFDEKGDLVGVGRIEVNRLRPVKVL
jgi:tRNA U55 pseudouridine synthase TruB